MRGMQLSGEGLSFSSAASPRWVVHLIEKLTRYGFMVLTSANSLHFAQELVKHTVLPWSCLMRHLCWEGCLCVLKFCVAAKIVRTMECASNKRHLNTKKQRQEQAWTGDGTYR